MVPRIPAAFLALFAFCTSSIACQGAGGPNAARNAAIGTGFALAAAGINRAVTHECWAMCRQGTFCDRASGLCVEVAPSRAPGLPAPPASPASVVLRDVPYPAGFSYEIPPASDPDANGRPMCEPGHTISSDAGLGACDLDASTATH